MHCNIDVNNNLEKKRSQSAEEHGIKRNRVIHDTPEQFIATEAQTWPKTIVEFQGIPDFPSFENYRSDLLVSKTPDL